MGGREGWKARLRVCGACAALTCAVVGVPKDAGADAPPRKVVPITRVRIKDSRARDSVRRALANARAQLADASCREVLSDFADEAGRPLQALLDTLEQPPEEYLATLFFYDGSGLPDCRRDVAAATIPGSHVVLICADRFARTRWPDGEIILIHEMLHSLGLGENPPAPHEISRRVQVRCFAHVAQRKPPKR